MSDDEAWRRLGQLLVARRGALGWGGRKRRALARAAGLPNDRVLAAIENAERQNFSAATIAQVEQVYAWAPGSIRLVLAGGDPIALPTGADVDLRASAPPALFKVDAGEPVSDDELLEVRAWIRTSVRADIDRMLDDLPAMTLLRVADYVRRMREPVTDRGEPLTSAEAAALEAARAEQSKGFTVDRDSPTRVAPRARPTHPGTREPDSEAAPAGSE